MASVTKRQQMQVFTLLPPPDADHEDVQPPHVSERDPKLAFELLPLTVKKSSFEKSQNIVHALEAFILAAEHGLYPPAWTIAVLTERFRRWHQSNGRLAMDAVLGLRGGRGRGRRDPAIVQLLHKDRDEMLALDMARLVGLGATIGSAAIAVAERLKATPTWNTSGWKLRALDDDQVKRKYRALDRGLVELVAKHVKTWPRSEIDQYLAKFPKHAVPAGIAHPKGRK